MTSDQSPRELFLANLSLVRQVVDMLARRHGLDGQQADDLESFIRLRLIENDYSILAQWRRHSSLKTYLTVVLQRLFQDYRNSVWGRWRPSSVALRLGPLAQALEEQLHRDGATLEEACRTLMSRYAVSRPELMVLHEQLPHRPARARAEPLDEVVVPSPAPTPEQAALDRAAELATARTVATHIRRLPARDRLLLRLRFKEDLSLPLIARALRVSPKVLTKRLRDILSMLRAELRRAGFERHDVVRLLQAQPTLNLGLQGDDGEFEQASPSNDAEEKKDRAKG